MNPTTEKQDIFAALRARIDALEAQLDELVARRKAKKAEITNTRKALRILSGESAPGRSARQSLAEAAEKGPAAPSEPPAEVPKAAQPSRRHPLGGT